MPRLGAMPDARGPLQLAKSTSPLYYRGKADFSHSKIVKLQKPEVILAESRTAKMNRDKLQPVRNGKTGCPVWIRTRTKRIKISCAATTPRDNVRIWWAILDSDQ